MDQGLGTLTSGEPIVQPTKRSVGDIHEADNIFRMNVLGRAVLGNVITEESLLREEIY